MRHIAAAYKQGAKASDPMVNLFSHGVFHWRKGKNEGNRFRLCEDCRRKAPSPLSRTNCHKNNKGRANQDKRAEKLLSSKIPFPCAALKEEH